MSDDVRQTQVRLGLLLFGVFCLLFAGTAVVALLYLQFD
jgi:hypothetical protein